MRSLLLPIILIGLGLVLFVSGCNSYNGFVEMDEDVENAWSKVQSAYQRRADLIPNLVNTVKGVAEFEKSTLTEVTQARSRATSVNIDPSNLSAEKLQEFQQAQGALSQSLGRLLVVSERYPQLQANQNFRELQAQLEGTENRIKVERDRFNDVVTEYNKKVRRFPGSLFAGLFGFDQRAQFEAEASAQNAPKVEF
ncbi:MULTISPECIES: LemA family protein [Phaeodactylibacter]|jgi:LemA protein|uniref:LemA family protein n=1 Tax=Phaeodactylibacter xiamenensis TaxID=1524460 RepID=A0A098SBU3_9BACT|nr:MULTISPECIES: LemA family protein [Phaeodactylibacter]KGE89615.1 LemA family protein [Phaeodactylibacter xiamenensis]MCI4649005.1 LemA family protein [Phaeodactylibacter sp.]MCI5092448.1 LemA family protein [Phaeodactylibacter sp.]MCR9055198.1 LemA family protein [bacterium]